MSLVTPTRSYKPWYPRADQLQLPYVPDNMKEQVRKLLAPALRKMRTRRFPIGQGHCWRTGQAVLAFSANRRIKYVEGVWLGGCGSIACNCGGAVRHAWNLVDNYIVDLQEEFLVFRGHLEFAPEREPQTVFTFEEVHQHYFDHPNPPTGIVSVDQWLYNGGFASLPARLKARVHLWGNKDRDKDLEEIEQAYFNRTTIRLRKRLRENFQGVKSAA